MRKPEDQPHDAHAARLRNSRRRRQRCCSLLLRASTAALSLLSSEWAKAQAAQQKPNNNSLARHLESAATAFSFLWWIIGFYWFSTGGQTLTKDAPLLYWLCVGLLASTSSSRLSASLLPVLLVLLPAAASHVPWRFCMLCWIKKERLTNTSSSFQRSCSVASATKVILIQSPLAHCRNAASASPNTKTELSCWSSPAATHNVHLACVCVGKWLRINAKNCPLCKCSIIQAYRDELHV